MAKINPSLILDAVYPVGSIYMSVNSTSPATLFGGTWSQLKDRFLLGCGDTYSNGATGGEATHTLTISEMPNHNHNMHVEQTYLRGDVSSSNGAGLWAGHSNNYWDGSNNHLELVGGDQPHNNMPPYLAVYMWKRTA